MKGEAPLGRCDICGVVGRTGRDFICEDCGNPHKIIHTCTNCGARDDLTGITLEELRKTYGPNISIGCAIAAPFCDKCPNIGSLPKKGQIRIYRVREPSH
jgi:hypothetical protein